MISKDRLFGHFNIDESLKAVSTSEEELSVLRVEGSFCPERAPMIQAVFAQRLFRQAINRLNTAYDPFRPLIVYQRYLPIPGSPGTYGPARLEIDPLGDSPVTPRDLYWLNTMITVMSGNRESQWLIPYLLDGLAKEDGSWKTLHPGERRDRKREIEEVLECL